MEVLYAGVSGSFCWCVSQNIAIEADVHCINHNPGKGISNWILFPRDIADGAAVFGYCQGMTSLPGRPGILDPKENVYKGLVVDVDGKRNVFQKMAEVLDSKMNGETLTVKRTVVFFFFFLGGGGGCSEFPAEKKTRRCGVPSMIWSRTAPTVTLLASMEKKRGALGAGKLRVVADARDFLDVIKASSFCASHRRDFGFPARAEYK